MFDINQGGMLTNRAAGHIKHDHKKRADEGYMVSKHKQQQGGLLDHAQANLQHGRHAHVHARTHTHTRSSSSSNSSSVADS